MRDGEWTAGEHKRIQEEKERAARGWGSAKDWEDLRKYGERGPRRRGGVGIKEHFDRLEMEVLLVLRRYGRVRALDVAYKVRYWRGTRITNGAVRGRLNRFFREGFVDKCRIGKFHSAESQTLYWLTEEGWCAAGVLLRYMRNMLATVEEGENPFGEREYEVLGTSVIEPPAPKKKKVRVEKPKPVKKVTSDEVVLLLLEESPKTVRQIADRMGIGIQSAWNRLKDLRAQKKVWCRKPPGRPALWKLDTFKRKG